MTDRVVISNVTLYVSMRMCVVAVDNDREASRSSRLDGDNSCADGRSRSLFTGAAQFGSHD